MSTKEVYDYVMNTPKNTNPAVLSSMLGHLSWNDLKDKPFYAETVEEDISGTEYTLVPSFGLTTHNANIPLKLGQVWKLGYLQNSPAGMTWLYLDEMEVAEADDGTLYIGDYPNASSVPYYVTSNEQNFSYEFIGQVGAYSFVLHCVSGTTTVENIHKLDTKYLPDNVGVGYILKPVVTEIYGGNSYNEVITDGTDMVKAIENGANVMILFPAGTIAPTAHLVTAMSWSIRDGVLFCETTLGAFAFSNAPIPSYLR